MVTIDNSVKPAMAVFTETISVGDRGRFGQKQCNSACLLWAKSRHPHRATGMSAKCQEQKSISNETISAGQRH